MDARLGTFSWAPFGRHTAGTSLKVLSLLFLPGEWRRDAKMAIGTAVMRTGDTAVGTAPDNAGVHPSVPMEGGENAGLAAVVDMRFEVNVHASLRTLGAASDAKEHSISSFVQFSQDHLCAFSASAVTSSAGRPVTVTVPPELVILVIVPV